jgi:DNA polymerase III sliding clamp (beta) subunit (PCNA family)
VKAEFECALLRAAIEAVLPAASTDEERPSLNAICIDVDERRARAVACDGHWMAEYQFEAKEVAEPGRVAIGLDRVHKVLSMISGELGDTSVASDDSLVRFEIERVGRVDCSPVASFPVTDPLWPVGDGKRISRVGMSPRLLVRIGKAFGCKKTNGLSFVFFGDNAPILISSEARAEMRAILMPIRQLSLELDGKEEKVA